jgi:hypothetical protein
LYNSTQTDLLSGKEIRVTSLRSEVERQLGRSAVPDWVWNGLSERNEVDIANRNIESLADEVKVAMYWGRQAAQARDSESARKTRIRLSIRPDTDGDDHEDWEELDEVLSTLEDRADAVSEGFAAEVAQYREVREIRTAMLGDQLLSIEAAEALLSSDEIKALPSHLEESDLEALLDKVVLLGSALGPLCEVSPWQEEEAEMFLLTGTVPFISPLQAFIDWKPMGVRKQAAIHLIVSPWVASDIVGRVFREGQRNLLEADNRPIEQKAIALFRFVTERMSACGQPPSWPDVKREWNEAYPAWAYSDHGKLSRDYRKTHERLMLPSWRSDSGFDPEYLLLDDGSD